MPPVIVIIPLEVSYSSALREMSTEVFGVAGRDQRPHAGEGAGDLAGAELVPKNSLTAASRYVDVALDGWTCVEVAVVVVVGRADERPAEPRQREDRAPAPAGTIAPARSGSRPRTIVRWVPRLGRICGTPASSWSSSGRSRSAQTPVALTTLARGPRAPRRPRVARAHPARVPAAPRAAPRRRRRWRRPRRSARPRRARSGRAGHRRSGSRRTGSPRSARARRAPAAADDLVAGDHAVAVGAPGRRRPRARAAARPLARDITS